MKGIKFGKDLYLNIGVKLTKVGLNPIQDGPFWGCSQMGGNRAPLPKICHLYPTIMKLGAVIPYQKKIQNIYKSRDTSPVFC